MAYTKKTLAYLKQSLADRHENEGTLPTSTATLAFWTRLLNKGINYCADKLRLEKATSLTTVSGTIALPDDFIVANRIFDASHNELSQIDPSEGNPTGYVYWIKGNQTDGFTLNTPSDKTYTVYYSFRPSELSADVDVCLIPDPEAPVAYAYAMLRKTESDPFEDADAALAEVDSRLREMQSASNLNINSMSFSLPEDGTSSVKYSWE
jgi:hypothetical protein